MKKERTYADDMGRKYILVEGSYYDTTDDRVGRWYPQRVDRSMLDKRGEGFATKKAAIEWIKKGF